MTKIPIVDENDQVIGVKEKDTITFDDIYRVTVLWLTNSRSEILLAKRALTKVNGPGQWHPAVAGTVEEGETYENNIIKEAEEELGIVNLKFEKGPRKFVQLETRFFVQWFFLKLDCDLKDFRINPKETAEIKWFSKEELKERIKTHPEDFVSNMPLWVEMFCH